MLVYNCGEIELCPPLGGDLPLEGVSPQSGGQRLISVEYQTHV